MTARGTRGVRSRSRAAMVLAGVMALGLVSPAASETGGWPGAGLAGTGPGAAAASLSDLPSGPYAVTLVTGDRVAVDVAADGFATATVDLVDQGRRQPSFSSVTDDHGLYVIPDDAARLVPEVLDRELFNVAALLTRGYHDAATAELPVVVTFSGAGQPQPLPAMRFAEPLGNVAGVNAWVDKEQAAAFGRAIIEQEPSALFAGIDRIWLPREAADGRAYAAHPTSDPGAVGCESAAACLQKVSAGTHGLVEVEVIGPDGQPFDGSFISLPRLLNVQISQIPVLLLDEQDSTYVYVAPVGTYSFFGLFRKGAPLYLLGDPEFEVTAVEPTRVVLDARDAHEITVSVDGESNPQHNYLVVQYRRAAEIVGGLQYQHHHFGAGRVFTLPTEAVSLGAFEHYTRWTFTGGSAADAYQYELVFPEPDRIPETQEYRTAGHPMATVHNAFHNDPASKRWNTFRHHARPYDAASLAGNRSVDVPGERTDYLSAHDSLWSPSVHAEMAPSPATAAMRGPWTVVLPDEQIRRSWYKSPVRPGVLEGTDRAAGQPAGDAEQESRAPFREGDILHLDLPELTDATTGDLRHWGVRDPALDQTAFRYFIDGELADERERPRGEFLMQPLEAAEYRLEVDWERQAWWWQTSTRTQTAWTFHSAPPDVGEQQVIPLLLVDLDLDLDLRNRAPGGVPFTIELDPRYPRGVDGYPIEQVRLFTSTDDGATWSQQETDKLAGGCFRTQVDHPDAGGFVTLRVDVEDAAGGALDQTIERAYALRGSDETTAPTARAVARPAQDQAGGGEEIVVSVGEEVTFDGSGSTGPADGDLSHRWRLGDCARAEGEAVTHTYSEPGVYEAVLTVTNPWAAAASDAARGASHTDTVVVTVVADE